MKKLLHLSAQLFTTFLLLFLFAFPQMGRGQSGLEYEISVKFGISNPWESPVDFGDLDQGWNGVTHIVIIKGDKCPGPLNQNKIGILKTKIQEAAATLTDVNLNVGINATDLSGLFEGCTNLETVKMGPIDKTCTNLNNCFKGCKQLKKIEFGALPNGRTSCEGMFQGCTNLEKIISGQLSVIASTTWKNAFNGCSKLEEIELGFAASGFNPDGLVGTFNGCSKLVFVDLSGVQGIATQDLSLDYTFQNCKSLQAVFLPQKTIANSVSMKYTFQNCIALNQRKTDLEGYASQAVSDPANIEWLFAPDMNANGGEVDPPFNCYGIDIDELLPCMKLDDGRPTPFVTCNTGKNIVIDGKANKIVNGAYYLLTNDVANEFIGQYIESPKFTLPATGTTYTLATAFSTPDDVLNDHFDDPVLSAVVVTNPKLASPATFYLTIENCANGSGVPNVVDINNDIVQIKDPILASDIEVYTSGTTALLDINSNPVQFDNGGTRTTIYTTTGSGKLVTIPAKTTLYGEFHLTTDKAYALQDTKSTNPEMAVNITDLPGEYYLVPDPSRSTATFVMANSGTITVSDSENLQASLPQPAGTKKAYFYVDKSEYEYYGLVNTNSICTSMGDVAAVGYTKPDGSTASGVYFLTPESLASLFPATAFAKVPEDPHNPGYYYIQSGVDGTNTCVYYPNWARANKDYCGIYNINKLQNITNMEGTFDGCTTLVFGVDNGTEPDKNKIGGSAGNFSSTQKNDARLDCTAAFRGVKSFGTFKDNISWTAIDLTMFHDIASLNSTFWNGGTKVKFYDAQDNPVDMQYAFYGHVGYQPNEVLYVPFKNISSLYLAFGQGCTIGKICFNSADQDPSQDPSAVSCHIQRAFDGNKGLTTLSNETLKNFKRFKSLYSKDGNKPNNSVLNRLTYTFAHCANLNEVDLSKNATGAWLSKPADDGELELLYTFIQCVKLEKADLSGIMDYTTSLDGTFDQCEGLLTCILGERAKPLSMSSTFWGNASLRTVKTRSTSVNNMIDLGGLQCITNLAQTFQNCVSLTNIDFDGPKNYTNSVGQTMTIALYNTFSGCKKLTAIDLTALTPHLSNTSCTTYTTKGYNEAPIPTDDTRAAFGNTFNGCTALTNVEFDKGTSDGTSTNPLTNENPIGMPQTFSGCTKLEKVENLNAFKRLTDLNQTFSGCEQLGSVEFDINSIDHEVKHLYRTFFNCKKIQTIDLGSISNKLQDIINTTSKIDPKTLAFGQTFFGCEALETVTFGSKQNSNSVSMCGTFYGCKALTDVKKIDKFTNITNLSQTFSGCVALQNVSFIGSVVNNKSSIGLFETFKGCKSITSIDLSGLTARLADQTKANFFQANNNDIINGAFAAFEGTFDGCTELTKVEFDKETSDGTSTNPLTNGNPIGMPQTFSGCTKLEEVNNLTAFTHLTQLNHTFYGCRQLDSIQFYGTSTAQHAAPMSLAGTFTNCSALTAITLPFVIGEQSISQTRGSTTSSVTYSAFGDNPGGSNPNKTFVGCISLEKVEFNGKDNSNQVNVDNLFRGLSNLDTVANFDKFHVLKGGSLDNTFNGCSALDSIKLSAKLSEASTSYSLNGTFNGCKELATIVNFDKLTQVSDLTLTFAECQKLDTLYFGFNPAGVDKDKADDTFYTAKTDGKKYLDCAWDKHDKWKGYAADGQDQYKDFNFIFEERYGATHHKPTFKVFDCDMFDVKPKLEADGNRVVEFVNVVKDGTAYTPDATGKYLVAGTDTCGAITVTATQITDIKLTASGTYDFHYRTENSGKGHCNKQATIALTLGHSDKHEVSDTICEDANYEWRDNAGKRITTLDKSDFGQFLGESQYGKYQTLTHDLEPNIEKMVVRTYTDNGRRFREEIYKYYAQRENCAAGECEISDSLILTVELVDTITTTVKEATCVCPGLAYQWTVENDVVITIDEAAFAPSATSALWTRTDNQDGSVTFEHSGTINGHLCATVYQLTFDNPTKPINDEKTDKSCESKPYKWDLGSSGATIELNGKDFVNAPTWTVAAFTSSVTYSAIASADRTLKAQQPATEQITLTYKVTLHNNQTACEDTYTLDLTVQQTHREQTTAQVCANVEYELKNVWGDVVLTLGSSEYNMGDVAANPFSNAGGSGTFSKTTLPNGTQRYVVSKTGGTQYDCLEEYTLDLTVNPVYDERPGGPDAANATTGTVCQNEDFVWNIAGDALVSAITLTYADYNQTATAFNSAGQQLQLDKTTSGTTQCYTYKGADKNTHCDRFYYLTLTVSPVIDQTLYSPYTDATQMAYCSDQTYVWNDGGFSYYLDSVQFYRPDGVYTENGITIEQTTISATPWIVQFVATVPSGSCQAKYKLLLALDDRFAANLVLANTVTDAVCNGSSYVWNYGSDGSVTVSPADPDYPAFPAGGQIKRRVSVPGASGCNDYYYLDLTINPSDHRTMTIDAVCRDENYFSYTGFPINEIVDFDASDLPADVKTYTHTVAHDCDQMTITFNFKEPERCQGKIVEGLVINQYECWLLMVNHNQLPLRDQEPVAYQWYVCQNSAPGDPNFLRNSNPIEGATKDFYTETQTLTGGYYWVKVTYIVGDEEFYYRSEPAALLCPNALEVVTTTDLMLSPNPVKQGSVVLIDGDALDVSAGAHIDVYTTAGQRVRSFDIATRAFKADVPAGCYLVQISVDRQTIVTAKMVVQ